MRYVDGGPSGGSSVSRPRSVDPHQRQRKFPLSHLDKITVQVERRTYNLYTNASLIKPPSNVFFFPIFPCRFASKGKNQKRGKID